MHGMNHNHDWCTITKPHNIYIFPSSNDKPTLGTSKLITGLIHLLNNGASSMHALLISMYKPDTGMTAW